MEINMEASTIGSLRKHDHDILSGRGNGVQYHPGNIYYRELINSFKLNYVSAERHKKREYCKLVHEQIKNRNPPGRFLAFNERNKLHYELTEEKVKEKIMQAFREKQPQLVDTMRGNEVIMKKSSVSMSEPSTISLIETMFGDTNNLDFEDMKMESAPVTIALNNDDIRINQGNEPLSFSCTIPKEFDSKKKSSALPSRSLKPMKSLDSFESDDFSYFQAIDSNFLDEETIDNEKKLEDILRSLSTMSV